jgi:hypothetical protein
MKINKTDYAYSVLEDILKVHTELKRTAAKYSEIIEEIDTNDYLIRFAYIISPNKFFFHVTNPYQDNSYQTVFEIAFFPAEKRLFQSKKLLGIKADNIHGFFENWSNLIQDYDSLVLDEDEKKLRQYQVEFFEMFKSKDENADTAAYDHKRQVDFYRLLGNIEEELKGEEVKKDEVAEIIKETTNLKVNVQHLTKNNFINRFAKIFALMKMHGIDFLQKFMDLLRKRSIDWGFDDLDDFMQ